MDIIEKIWGHEEVIVNDFEHGYCGKLLHLKRGYECSYHCHKKKDETFYILKGTVQMKIEGIVRKLKAPFTIHIPVNTYHCFRGITNAVIIEFSMPDSPEDSYRKNKSHKVKSWIKKIKK